MHFLIYLRNAWTYFDKTYHNYALPDAYDTDDIFKVMGSRSGSQTTFSKNVLSMEAY